jgi:hypothetical protein
MPVVTWKRLEPMNPSVTNRYDLLRTASPHEAWVLGVGHFELLPRCPSLRQDTDLEAAHQEQKPGRLCSANNMRSDQDQVS